jgi:hypothetical protein
MKKELKQNRNNYFIVLFNKNIVKNIVTNIL